VLVLDMTDILPPLEKYKYDTWRIVSVKCYIDNSVRLRSCIRNVNKHLWCRCQGGSQYLLSVYILHGIILTSIISLTDLSAVLCLFMIFTGSCMTEFDLPANYHSDPESLIRKSHSRLSSPGSSGSHVREIVDKFHGSPPPHEPALMAAQKCINDFLALSSANVKTGPEMNIEEEVLNLNQFSSTWCSKTHSTARPQRMLMLIFITSWRSAAHSLSEE
jgi:hypothetical protein